MVVPEERVDAGKEKGRLFTEDQEVDYCLAQRDPMYFIVEGFVLFHFVFDEVLLLDEDINYNIV